MTDDAKHGDPTDVRLSYQELAEAAAGINARLIAERIRADAAEAQATAYEQRLRGWACEVCWTMSWAPCPPNTPNAIPDSQSASGDWMICQMCARDAAIRAAEAQRDRLVAALLRFGPKVTTVSEWHSAECPVTHYPSIALMPCSDICKQARAALADVPDALARQVEEA